MFGTILFAVDGSEYSKKAIPIAAGMAKVFDGEVIICHVREREISRFMNAPPVTEEEAEAPTEWLES